MIRSLLLALIPALSSCFPNVAKEFTRTPRDKKTLREFALIRPRWPNLIKPEERRTQVDTSVSRFPDGLNHGGLDFTAEAGTVYPFRAQIDPSKGSARSTHYWELDEEDSDRVILKEAVEPSYRPIVTPTFIAI